MIKSKNFNNVSDKIVPKLGRDEIVYFQCSHITYDEHGTPIYPDYSVPSQDKIWDDEKKDYVDIAYITRPVGSDDKVTFGNIWFERNEKCLITLRGNRSNDVLLYEYLKLSNYNESNPNRDTSYAIIFKELNPALDQKNTLTKAKKEQALRNLALDGDLTKLRELLMQRGIETKGWKEDAIRSKVLEEGQKSPFDLEEVPQRVDSTDYLKLLKEAEEADLIYYDAKQGAYLFRGTNEKIADMYKSVTDKIQKLAAIVQADPKLQEKFKKLL